MKSNYAPSDVRELVLLCGGKAGKYLSWGQGLSALFLLDSQGRSIGRAIFLNTCWVETISNKSDMIKSACETDLIIMRLEHARVTGHVIDTERFWKLVEQARRQTRNYLSYQREWRKKNDLTNPDRKRKSLITMNPRTILRKLISDEKGGPNLYEVSAM